MEGVVCITIPLCRDTATQKPPDPSYEQNCDKDPPYEIIDPDLTYEKYGSAL